MYRKIYISGEGSTVLPSVLSSAFTSWWWISIASLGVVITSIPGVNSHDLLVVSLIRFVDAGEVLTGSPDLGDGDGRDGHE